MNGSRHSTDEESLGRGGGHSDGERGERQLGDESEARDAMDRADRLEGHTAPGGESVGVKGAGDPQDDVGRDADASHGESGDAGSGR